MLQLSNIQNDINYKIRAYIVLQVLKTLLRSSPLHPSHQDLTFVHQIKFSLIIFTFDCLFLHKTAPKLSNKKNSFDIFINNPHFANTRQ